MTSKFVFEDATKTELKARIALEGVAGGGKTWTSLLLARGLVGPTGTIGLIDTERRKASLYSDIFRFKTLPLDKFAPEVLIEAVAAANGLDALIIDSFSHFWFGADGMLEQVDRAAKAKAGGNSFGGWKEMRPIERRMLDTLLAYPGHLIVTMRTKSEWVVELNARGKNEPKRIGTKAEQREGLEYEFDLVGNLDLANTLVVTKSRCPQFSGAVIDKPTEQMGADFAAWLADGATSTASVLDLRDLALDPHAVADDLIALHRQAAKAGLLNGAVVDEHGDTVTLESLIVAKGKEARQREQAAASTAREAADDAWMTSPAAPAAEMTTETPMVTDKQHARMHVSWAKLGYAGDENRDNRLMIINNLLKRPDDRKLGSSKLLTYAEAETVIAALEKRVQDNANAAAERAAAEQRELAGAPA